jgi:hypothetical protein
MPVIVCQRLPCRSPRYLKHFASLNDRLGNSGGRFATGLLGVKQLPARLLVMLEATAID